MKGARDPRQLFVVFSFLPALVDNTAVGVGMRKEDMSFIYRVVAVQEGRGHRFFHLLVPHRRLLFSPLVPLGERTIPRRSSHWAPLSCLSFSSFFFLSRR